MKTFARRRWSLSLAALGVAVVLAGAWYLARLSLRPVAMYTGWLLLALVLMLTFFNARKKLPFLPLFNANTWMQLHIYVGWLAVFTCLLHTGLRWPDGRLESILSLTFFLVAASGAFGLWLTRRLPPRLARSGESLVFERIPLLRHRLLAEVKDTVRKAEDETQSTTLADFYLRILSGYFSRRPTLFFPLTGDDPAHRRVMLELTVMRRFLDTRELEFADQLGDLIETKRNLDFQLAGQRLLKVWLFVHVPLTYGLLVLVSAHVWLALHYSHRL